MQGGGNDHEGKTKEKNRASGSYRGNNACMRILYHGNGDEKYYVLLEEEYLKQVREILKQEGYSNCGLTLTYTKEVGGERRYHLRIHNQRFDRLNDIEKKAILNRVGKVDFGVEGCSLYQEYN